MTKEKNLSLFTLFIGGVDGVGIFRLNIYLINIPWDCSSLTKYVQRRLAGNADGDFLKNWESKHLKLM